MKFPRVFMHKVESCLYVISKIEDSRKSFLLTDGEYTWWYSYYAYKGGGESVLSYLLMTFEDLGEL